MNIDDYFDAPKSKETVVMIDYNNMCYRCIFGAQNQYMKNVSDPNYQMTPDDLYVIWKNYMIQNLFDYVKEFKATKFIVPIDSPSWRKDYYKEYKGGRDDQRKASAVDFEKFFPIMNAFVDELKTILPNVRIITIPKCEVDDIIAVLCKNVFMDDNVIIVSTDGDFKQLLTNKNIKIYNPINKAYTECADPKLEIQLKIVIGDGGNGTGDNIPNILVMEGHEFEGEKTIGVGPSTAEEILEKGLESDYVVNKVGLKYNTVLDKKKKKFEFDKISKEDIIKKVKENYQRNLKLISFEHIPKEIERRVLEGYQNYKLGKYSAMTCFNYLMENQIRVVADNLQVYSMFLKELR